MIPCVLTPNVCLVCEKPVVTHQLRREGQTQRVADLEPNGGFSAVTSWTDEAVFGILADCSESIDCLRQRTMMMSVVL